MDALFYAYFRALRGLSHHTMPYLTAPPVYLKMNFPFPLFPSYPAPLNSTERQTRGSEDNNKRKTELKYMIKQPQNNNFNVNTDELFKRYIPSEAPWNQRRRSTERERCLAGKGR